MDQTPISHNTKTSPSSLESIQVDRSKLDSAVCIIAATIQNDIINQLKNKSTPNYHNQVYKSSEYLDSLTEPNHDPQFRYNFFAAVKLLLANCTEALVKTASSPNSKYEILKSPLYLNRLAEFCEKISNKFNQIDTFTEAERDTLANITVEITILLGTTLKQTTNKQHQQVKFWLKIADDFALVVENVSSHELHLGVMQLVAGSINYVNSSTQASPQQIADDSGKARVIKFALRLLEARLNSTIDPIQKFELELNLDELTNSIFEHFENTWEAYNGSGVKNESSDLSELDNIAALFYLCLQTHRQTGVLPTIQTLVQAVNLFDEFALSADAVKKLVLGWLLLHKDTRLIAALEPMKMLLNYVGNKSKDDDIGAAEQCGRLLILCMQKPESQKFLLSALNSQNANFRFYALYAMAAAVVKEGGNAARRFYEVITSFPVTAFTDILDPRNNRLVIKNGRTKLKTVIAALTDADKKKLIKNMVASLDSRKAAKEGLPRKLIDYQVIWLNNRMPKMK